jgi:hypothetical protein
MSADEPFVHWDDADLPAPPALEGPAALAESQARFPRSRLELEILEALRQMYPLPLTAIQLAAMVRAPHLDVRNRLVALAMLGTITRPRSGYYQHRSLGEAERG